MTVCPVLTQCAILLGFDNVLTKHLAFIISFGYVLTQCAIFLGFDCADTMCYFTRF